MERKMEKIVYDGEGRPHFESKFEVFLNFVFRFLHKTVKGASSFVQRILPTGVDSKTTIKK